MKVHGCEFFAVITTIQRPSVAVESLADLLARKGAGQLLVIGDKKGPVEYPLVGAEFFNLQRQIESRFDLARALPVGHYARKNIGYLEAIARGASCIYETDDDNAPLEDWGPRDEHVDVRNVEAKGWVNVYRCFSGERIWPRGLPLDVLHGSFSSTPVVSEAIHSVQAPIQQGLANGSPDVDAIWRLVLDAPFEFEAGPSVLLPPGVWCPFNSQSTWWWPDVYPLLYLPSHCSFRMTDIWRSFVAQRCLWALGLGVVFHAPEVFQDRNEHNLMRDFSDEIPGYLQNRRIAELLDSLSLDRGVDQVGNNLVRCYEALVNGGILPRQELELVAIWLQDLRSL